ncbi:hypothetical protein [Yinghuangia sp. YIM S09857]|uniref:hypothetical protein n=1 Tax=Yinghuangia sp. YIM S09857 TaxID=3436929 RepID=UPI003F53C9C5
MSLYDTDDQPRVVVPDSPLSAGSPPPGRGRRTVLGVAAMLLLAVWGLAAVDVVPGLPSAGAVALVVAMVATAVGSWHVACAVGMRRAVDTATLWVLLLIAQLSGLALLVGGLARQLNSWALFSSALVVAVAEVVFVRRHFDGARRKAQTSVRSRAAGLWRHPAVVILGLALAVQYVWRAAMGTFIGPLDWDGLWYHITGADIWLQNGNIGHTADVIWADVYPQGQELLIAWSGAFLGTTRYSWTSNIPYFMLALPVVAALARSAGANRNYSVMAAFGFLAVPVVFLQASTSYVDVGATATALAALQFAVASRGAALDAAERGESVRRELYRHYAIIGLALGLAIGVKSSNLLVAALVVAVMAVQTWRVARPGVVGSAADGRGAEEAEAPAGNRVAALLRRAVATLRLGVPGTLVMGIPMMLLGSYWYLRTWIRYGNPFHPFTMLGFHGDGTVRELIVEPNTPKAWLDEGWVQQTKDTWLADRERHPYSYDITPGGFGQQWLYILVPAIVLGILLFLVRRRFDVVYGLIVPVAVAAVSSPAPWSARYVLTLPAVGCVCLAAVLSFVAGRSARAGANATAVAVADPDAGAATRGARARKIAYGRQAVAAALALVFVATTVRTMWWATSPTHIWVVGARDWHMASVSELADLMDDPRRDKKLANTHKYLPIRQNVPDGAKIAFTTDCGSMFLHLVIGDEGKRKIAEIGSPRDAADLAARLDKSGSRFVMLSEFGENGDILQQVRNDPAHYREIVGGGGIPACYWPGRPPGANLFEVIGTPAK